MKPKPLYVILCSDGSCHGDGSGEVMVYEGPGLARLYAGRADSGKNGTCAGSGQHRVVAYEPRKRPRRLT